jgi:metallo-beta-lactamase family protein
MTKPALTFLGAAGTVTGSKYLLDTGTGQFLIDCGMFQGLSDLRRRNWTPPAVNPRDLDAIVLTHAHLDHTGYLPVLARHGWQGPVYCTEGTAQLAEIVLADSAHLLEEEAAHANTYGWTKHKPAVPLYDSRDAQRACAGLRVVGYGEDVSLPGGVSLRLGRAGHILGSSWAQLSIDGAPGEARTLLSSGDLGRPAHPLLLPPDPRPDVDVLLIESTYGQRRHEPADSARERFAEVIRRTVSRGGSVLVPAFAVDRTEVLLFEINRLRRAGEIPVVPIVVDSPMALNCLRVYQRAQQDSWPELRPDLPKELFDPENFVEARTAAESIGWNDPRKPAIIISASGMASGGRVLYHLREMLPNHRHTIAIVGFAPEGTRARQLLDGATEVKIHGRYIPVNCEVFSLDSFSAHADADELVGWATAAAAPSTCYVVHGEPRSSRALAGRLHAQAGWTAVVPRDGERVLI